MTENFLEGFGVFRTIPILFLDLRSANEKMDFFHFLAEGGGANGLLQTGNVLNRNEMWVRHTVAEFFHANVSERHKWES